MSDTGGGQALSSCPRGAGCPAAAGGFPVGAAHGAPRAPTAAPPPPAPRGLVAPGLVLPSFAVGASHDGHCPLILPRANFLGSRASTALTYCRVNINFSFPTLVPRKTNSGKQPSSPFLRLHFNLPPSLPASQPLGGARAAGAAERVGARCVPLSLSPPLQSRISPLLCPGSAPAVPARG